MGALRRHLAKSGYALGTETRLDFRQFLNQAIANTRRAYDRMSAVPNYAIEHPDALAVVRSNLGYHLATKRSESDRAFELVDDLATSKDPDLVESYAWVSLRFAAPGDVRWNNGLAALRRALCELPEPAEGWCEVVRARYRGAFAQWSSDHKLPDSLAELVAGGT